MQILRGAASVRQCQNHNRDASKQPTSEQAEHAAAALLQACVRGFQSRVQTFLLRAKSHDRQRDVHALLTEIEASNRLVRQRLLASNGTRATITRHTLRTAEGALVLVNGKTPARTARRGGGGAGGAGDYDDSRSESNTDDGVPGSEGGLWARRDATATSTDNCFCCKMYRERNTTAQCKEHACTRTRGAASAGTPNARSNPAAAAATATATAAAVDRTAAAVKQVAQAAAATGRHKGRERTAPSGFDSRNRVPAVQAPICLEDVMVESRDDWCRWFHGNPDRARLKAQLKARHHGAFLVRISDSHRCFVVSANDCGSVRHFLLGQDKKGRYGVVGWEQKGVHVRFLRRPLFPTIQELIVHYMTHPISPTCTLREALLRITRVRAGAISVTDDEGRLVGIFTDGDLRRRLVKGASIDELKIADLMTRDPTTIQTGRLVSEAIRIMRERKFDELPVVDGEGRSVGVLDIQDVLGILTGLINFRWINLLFEEVD